MLKANRRATYELVGRLPHRRWVQERFPSKGSIATCHACDADALLRAGRASRASSL